MAEQGKAKGKLVKQVNYAFMHKLAAATALVAFCVVIAAGVMAEARVFTIAYRALVVILVIGVVSRILIRILATYEEMNSGKA